MKVTALLTVFNLERYVAAAVESVLRQTRRPDEIVVVDDASTDGSEAILRRYGRDISYFRLSTNEGVLAATMRGLRASSGDVVMFLDGDDVWDAEKVETLCREFANGRTAMASHDVRFIDSEGRVFREADPLQAETRRYANERRSDLSGFMRRSILRYEGRVWLGSAWGIRKAALDLASLERAIDGLDPRLLYQDHIIATQILLSNPELPLGYSPSALASYRVHGSNYSGASSDLAGALRNVRKGRATRQVTRNLVATFSPTSREDLATQDLKLREYDYLESLYSRRFARALGLAAGCVRIWGLRQSVKEVIRMSGSIALGPERFIQFKQRLAN